jgi:hypothetical protein
MTEENNLKYPFNMKTKNYFHIHFHLHALLFLWLVGIALRIMLSPQIRLRGGLLPITSTFICGLDYLRA